MFKVKSLIFVLLSSYFYGPQIWAKSDFRSQIIEMTNSCPESICHPDYSVEAVYEFSKNNILDPNFKTKMQNIATTQAQIWGDTILEGFYEAEGNTRIDTIYKLFKKNELLGYMLTYSERAWDISDCQYDGINPETLLDCTPGRIVETSFVSLDFKEYFYTEKTYARFK